jgi:hypothetical protein
MFLKVDAQILDGSRRPDEIQDDFVEGIHIVLVVMNVATSRNSVSTVTSQNIVCNGVIRFIFFH